MKNNRQKNDVTVDYGGIDGDEFGGNVYVAVSMLIVVAFMSRLIRCGRMLIV